MAILKRSLFANSLGNITRIDCFKASGRIRYRSLAATVHWPLPFVGRCRSLAAEP
jgi:hypothetical protein